MIATSSKGGLGIKTLIIVSQVLIPFWTRQRSPDSCRQTPFGESQMMGRLYDDEAFYGLHGRSLLEFVCFFFLGRGGAGGAVAEEHHEEEQH
jgi:hypothetical protein